VNALIDAALSRSRTVLATLALVLIAGLYAYVTIPREADPDISLPFVMVNVFHEGISPEDSERLLVKPIESELQSIPGVEEMTATASENSATVIVEFGAGVDVKAALSEVRNKVDIAKSKLPVDAEEPVVNEMNFSDFPILVVSISGDIPERSLLHLAQELQDDIETLPAVLEAPLIGTREEVVEVNIDIAKLESYNISQETLIERVARNNRVVAAGTLDTGQGRFPVKVPGLLETAQDILELPLKVEGDAVVTLSDVATIRRTFKDQTSIARLNGKPAIGLEIKKRVGSNILETVAKVKAITELHAERWPAGIAPFFSQDQSYFVNDQVSQLQSSVITAVLLVVIVIIITLGARSALLVGMAIPTSFLFGILALTALGYTLNTVVLFALVLAVGLLVDGAIVVTEFADRKLAEGLDKRDAYAQAAKRMAWPITASIATTLAAFVPLLYWPDTMGEFMKYLPVTLMTTLIGSLISALIFLPTLGAIFGRSDARKTETLAALSATQSVNTEALKGFTGWYARMLSKVIHTPFRVLIAAVVLLLSLWTYFFSLDRGMEFMPSGDSHLINLEVRARGNLSVLEKNSLVLEVEELVSTIEDIDSIYANVGGGGAEADTGWTGGSSSDRIGLISLELTNWRNRRKSDEIVAEIRELTDHLAGIIIVPIQMEFGPSDGKDIELEIASSNKELMAPIALKIRDYMENNVDGLYDIGDTLPLPGIQWEITVDRAQAQKFGADISTVGGVVQMVTNGLKIDEFRPDDADEELDIRVRFPEGQRSIETLDRLQHQTPHGPIPFSNFVKRTPEPRVSSIERVNGRPVVKIFANTGVDFVTDKQVSQITQWLGQQDFDPRVAIQFRGQAEEQAEAGMFLINAFIIALFMMAIILVTQFNSFYHTLLILSAVILSTFGVVVGMIVTGRPFYVVMTGVGIIALAGIVVNNNIVLIDTFTRLKKAGMAPYEAIVRTGAQRLRPVLLTTFTTVVGVMPMLSQLSIDFVNREVAFGAPTSDMWVDVAMAIVFGLSFATMLTLIVTPCLLAAPYVVKEARAKRRGATKTTEAPAE
jgi:multidrug efflux pump